MPSWHFYWILCFHRRACDKGEGTPGSNYEVSALVCGVLVKSSGVSCGSGPRGALRTWAPGPRCSGELWPRAEEGARSGRRSRARRWQRRCCAAGRWEGLCGEGSFGVQRQVLELAVLGCLLQKCTPFYRVGVFTAEGLGEGQLGLGK